MLDERRARRARVLREHGAAGPTIDELLAYTEPPVVPPVAPSFPLANEPHLDAWTRYADEAVACGAVEALRAHFVQLRFPIRAGISQELAYREATRKGRFEAADAFSPGLLLRKPDAVDLNIHDTIAGRVPVVVAADRADFEALVRAFSDRNEPAPVPASMGACIVTGLINWDRVAEYRRSWTRNHQDASEADWLDEFRRFATRKELYQDRFIILSSGPYSGIPAADIGVNRDDWLSRSLVLRREHECTHYFTYRALGTMRNHIFDELVADFVGLVSAFGEYRADLARRFLGLDVFPETRPGSRIELYCGTLSPAAIQAARSLAVTAIANLERLGAGISPRGMEPLGAVVYTLWTLTLEELASTGLQDFIPEMSRGRF